MRKRLIIVGNDTELINHIDKLLDLDEYKKETTLTELLGKNFEKKIKLKKIKYYFFVFFYFLL